MKAVGDITKKIKACNVEKTDAANLFGTQSLHCFLVPTFSGLCNIRSINIRKAVEKDINTALTGLLEARAAAQEALESGSKDRSIDFFDCNGTFK